MSWPRYEGAAANCSGKAQPGAEALMEVFVRDFGAKNLGIYNCRSVRGSTNRSIHGDGRALDPGYSRISDGDRLLAVLLRHRMALGIQLIIWNRRIYSAKAPLGARYQGTVPHTDHLHVELTWDAARTLTVNRVRQIIGTSQASPPEPAPKPPPPPPNREDTDVTAYLRLNKPGHPMHGRIEAVGDFHRRHIGTKAELDTLLFLGAKVQDVDPAAFNNLTANKTVVDSRGPRA